MEIDRRSFLTALGGAAAIETMESEVLADALEHHMMEELDAAAVSQGAPPVAPPIEGRRGTGSLFLPSGEGAARQLKPIPPMPDRPTDPRLLQVSVCASHARPSERDRCAQEGSEGRNDSRVPAARRGSESHQS